MSSNIEKRKRKTRDRLKENSTEEQLGQFEILAVTFMKARWEKLQKDRPYDDALRKAKAWFVEQPNVIFASSGEGMGWHSVCISFHENYASYVEFRRKHDAELFDLMADSESFIANMDPKIVMKPFRLRHLVRAR